jgi:hypothetical protein
MTNASVDFIQKAGETDVNEKYFTKSNDSFFYYVCKICALDQPEYNEFNNNGVCNFCASEITEEAVRRGWKMKNGILSEKCHNVGKPDFLLENTCYRCGDKLHCKHCCNGTLMEPCNQSNKDLT